MYYFFSSISFEFSQSKIFFVELQGSGMAETFWASSMTSHESLSLFLCINLSCEFSNFFSKWSTPFQSSIILVWITTVQVWLSFLHCHEFNMVPVEDVSFKALMISGEKVDQVIAGSFSSSISCTISSLMLFPLCLLFLHLLLGDAVPPVSWRTKPGTQVEGICHSVHFLQVCRSLLRPLATLGAQSCQHTLRSMWAWVQHWNWKKAHWCHWFYAKRSSNPSCFFSFFGG